VIPDKIPYQAIALVVSIIAIIGVGLFGIFAYLLSPYIFIDRTLPFSELDTRIILIEDQNIDREFLFRFPEFSAQKDEARWWQEHQAVYEAIRFKESVDVIYQQDQGLLHAKLPVKPTFRTPKSEREGNFFTTKLLP
jgi:hypothetical protein